MAEKYSFSNPPRLFTKALGKYLGSYESLRKEASKQKINGHSGMNYSQLLKALLSVFIEQQIEQDNIHINIFKNLVEGEKSHISYIIKIMEFVPSVSGFRALATTSRGAFQLAYSRYNIKEYVKSLRLTEETIRDNIFKKLVEGEKSHVSFIITEIMEFVPSVSGFRALATTSRGAFQLAYNRFNIKDKEYLKHLRLTEEVYLMYRQISEVFISDIDRRGGRKKAMMYYHEPTKIIDQIQDDYWLGDESDPHYAIRNAKYGDILWYRSKLEVVIPHVYNREVFGKTTTSEMPEEIYNLIKKQGICYKDAYNEFKERLDEWGWSQYNEEGLDFFPRYLLE
tara:strand:+ start:2704 stop:3720 length:1017 start_codon:yes stop_codon:yes gene_type:complete